MKTSSLLRLLCILVTSVFLICTPASSFAASGHGGGGGGFHGGGFGGGFHGGGFGGHRGDWGGAGWRGGYGWRGYGWRGWGYPGWGWAYPGWGWGIGVGFGWGWGYPYAYGYPYYYYPYYPYYPYYRPDPYAPVDSDRYRGGNQDPHQNSPQQDSEPERPTGASDKIQAMTVSHKTAGDIGSANYWLLNYQQRTVPRQQVRNVIQALLAMPPEARRRQIESGRYRNFSSEEQELLNQIAQVSPRDGAKPVLLRPTLQ